MESARVDFGSEASTSWTRNSAGGVGPFEAQLAGLARVVGLGRDVHGVGGAEEAPAGLRLTGRPPSSRKPFHS